MSQVIGNEVVENVAEVESETVKRSPLNNYEGLSAENQAIVDEIVENVLDKISFAGSPDLYMLLGILDKLNAEKKTAREVEKQKEKERKAAAKDAQLVLAKKISEEKLVRELDKVDCFMSTAKVTILQAEVIKVTEKSARIDVTADSEVFYKNRKMTAQEAILAGASLKLGKKSIAFGRISNLTRNGVAINLAA